MLPLIFYVKYKIKKKDIKLKNAFKLKQIGKQIPYS